MKQENTCITIGKGLKDQAKMKLKREGFSSFSEYLRFLIIEDLKR